MLDYLTTDKPALLARAENALAGYGRALLAADAAGATPCTADALDLATGLNVLSSAVPAQKDERTAAIIAYLLDRHKLNEAALTPFAPLPVVQQGAGTVGGLQAIYFASILGPVEGNGALAAALATKVDKVSNKGLSTNDYLNADKAKLGLLPNGFAQGTGISLSSNANSELVITSTVSVASTVLSVNSITENLGGFVAGTSFTGTAEDAFRKLLVRYQVPAFTSFSIAGTGSSLVEIGTPFTAGTKAFAWATSNGGSVTNPTVVLRDITAGTVLTPVDGQNAPVGQPNNGAFNAYVTGFTAVRGESHRYRISALNTQAATLSADLVISGANKIWYGTTATVPAASGAERGLGNSLFAAPGSFTLVTGTANKTYCFFVPTGLSVVSIFDQDASGAPIIGSYVPSAFTGQDASGAAVPGTLYTMTQGTPYIGPTASGHRHLITLA